MLIKVIDWSKNTILDFEDGIDFYLERDNWNDFGFYTYYHLHLSATHTSDKQPALIGGVKILKKEQTEGQIYLIELGNYQKLPEDFCSLGLSLDYYQRISELNPDLKNSILKALNDIIYTPEINIKFSKEDGYRISLMRNFTDDSDIFSLAPVVLSGDFDSIPDTGALNFSFKTSEMQNFIEFDFSSIQIKDDWYDDFGLPSRIIVIIGKNGSGKTTFLSKLSRLVFASTNDRVEKLNKIAEIEPKGLGFPRIISVSYSAFDTFKVPGIRAKEIEQIAKEIDNGEGRYIYCGIRNITKELSTFLKQLEEKGEYLTEKDILSNKYNINILKTTEQINDEFKKSLSIIFDNKKKN